MRDHIIPAALSAAAVVLATAALGTAFVDRANDSNPAPAARISSLSADEICVALLSRGGRPQDCGRMFLMTEFPGYPR